MKTQFHIFGFCSVFLIATSLRAQKLAHTELLGRPTDKEITLQIAFSDSAEACVRYGISSGNLTQQTSWQLMRVGDPSEIVINNLSPNKQYFYRLVYRKPKSTNETQRPEYTFHTQRPANESFTFVVQADPHLDALSDTAVYKPVSYTHLTLPTICSV